jgi:hypothetical protein
MIEIKLFYIRLKLLLVVTEMPQKSRFLAYNTWKAVPDDRKGFRWFFFVHILYFDFRSKDNIEGKKGSKDIHWRSHSL